MGLFSPTKQVATSVSEPWAPAQPYLAGAIASAKGLFGSSAGTVAPQSWETTRAGQMIKSTALAGDANVGAAQGALRGLLTGTGGGADTLAATARGDFLDQPNPYLEAQIQDQADKIGTQLRSVYSAGGRYGSSTMNQDLADRLGAFRGGILSQNYEAERGRQMAAAQALESGRATGLGMAGEIGDLRYGDADRLAGLGSYNDERAQQKLDNPWDRLSRYTAAITGAAGGAGTTTETTPGPSLFSKILGGITGIGSMVGSFAPGLSKLGLLSDRRAKTDIKRVGATDDGLPVYTYRYKDGGPVHMGVMAQEAAVAQPQAVGRRADGLLAVDYSQVT